MTIRLLRPWNGYNVNDVLSLDSATESALIADYTASSSLAGGRVATNNTPFSSDSQRARTVAAEEFGVSPQATATNNTAALQAALNQAAQITLYTPGTYAVTGDIFTSPAGTLMTIGPNVFFSVNGTITTLNTLPTIAPGTFATKRTISGIIPFLPQSVAVAFTGTQNLMMTAPGDFDAIAMVAFNSDSNIMTIDACVAAVSERSDTSKTVPIINGSSFDVLAAAGTQNGWVPVTWDGGSTSTTVAVGTLASPTLKISDWIPLTSIPRVDNPAAFPLVMLRQYTNARALSVHVFPNAAAVDDFNVQMAPYEFYQTAQAVDGVTTPASFTTVWNPGSNTQSVRIFGVACRLRGTGHFVLAVGDSIMRSIAAQGSLASLAAGNTLGGWFPLTMKRLASRSNPVGWFNAGYSSKPTAASLASFKQYAAILKPSVGVFPPYSPNDGALTVAISSAASSRALDFTDYCLDNAIAPVLVTPVPYGGSGSETRRFALVNKMKAIKGTTAWDANAPVYDARNTQNNFWVAGTNFDDTHPNATGHAAISAGVVGTVAAALA
jgi:hypothetical protein